MRAVVGSVVVVVLLLVVATGCGGGEPDSQRTVVASFYPLAWAVERVVPRTIRVVNLTPAGAEPHDLELTPGDITAIRDAELVVYLSGGFQPAVEEAVANRDGRSLDVVAADSDPHLWLDPIRFARVVESVARSVGVPGAAAPVVRELRRLDTEYRRGLADCERRVLVTSHASFGRLAARYGLTQVALTGRSPEAEPGPRELQRIVEEVRASGATTVFAEPLVSPRLAETVAREAGVEVAMLDPLEGLSEERLAAGEDYPSVMRSNLATLREALGCR